MTLHAGGGHAAVGQGHDRERSADERLRAARRRRIHLYRDSKLRATLVTEETGRLVNPSGVAYLTIDGDVGLDCTGGRQLRTCISALASAGEARRRCIPSKSTSPQCSHNWRSGLHLNAGDCEAALLQDDVHFEVIAVAVVEKVDGLGMPSRLPAQLL